MRKIKVLFAMGGTMKRAGAETMIMQYLRQLIKDDRFEFSILVHGYQSADYDAEIHAMGVPLYHVPVRGQNPLTYKREVRKILRAHPIDIVHCNMDTSCGYFLELAKECGVKIRIAHSHSTEFLDKSLKHVIIATQSKKEIHKVANLRFACSEKAGKWLFPDDHFIVVKNAIDMAPYTLVPSVRKAKRNELGINDNSLVLAHIGRFSPPKNHVGLLRIFAALKQERIDVKLLLMGTGELLPDIKALARDLQIENSILFLGVRSDIPELLQAADTFVMPSNWEGLPVSGIEAQASGLPCFFSTAVTQEVCMTDFAKRIPKDDISAWVNVLKNIHGERNVKEAQHALQKSGYDIKIEAKKLKKYYVKAFERIS